MRLFRTFAEREHAVSFAEDGILRLQELRSYRTVSDKSRRDHTEGEVRLRVPHPAVATVHLDRSTLKTVGVTHAPGFLNFSSEDLTPYYISCLAHADVGLSYTSKWGRFVVEIVDSKSFVSDVETALPGITVGDRELHFEHFGPVEYTKGLIGEYPPLSEARLSYSQKPPEDHADREYRLVIRADGALSTAPPQITLSLSDTKTYCRLIAP